MTKHPEINEKVLEMAAAIQPADNDSEGNHIKYLNSSYMELTERISRASGNAVEGLTTRQVSDILSHTMFERYRELELLVKTWGLCL